MIQPSPGNGIKMSVENLQLRLKARIVSHQQEKFLTLMEMDGITKHSIAKSLDMALNRRMVFKAGEGGGASGSFFFFSHDNKFLIKTLSKSEKRLFLGMLDDYISHI